MSQNDCVNAIDNTKCSTANVSIENNRNSTVVNVVNVTSTATANAASEKKKVRRAFSMPRNPFRLSRRFNKPNTKDVDPRAMVTDSTIINESLRSPTTIVGAPPPPSSKSNQTIAAVASVVTAAATTNITINTTTVVATATATSTTTTTTTSAAAAAAITTTATTATATILNGPNAGAAHKHRIFRRPSFKKFLSRIAQQMTSINIGAKHSSTSDRVPPLGSYVWPPDQVPGVTGLKNHGNTCFMNAVLQCLSHTDILAEYFVLDQYKADLKRRNKLTSRKFGTKGELTEQLALVLKALWTCKLETDYSTNFKAVVDRYGSQFRSSTQHDAQEFLFWLLDKVHEDLNTASKRKYKSIKNSYGRSDEVIAAETLANHIRCNNSFVQAVFQAQFRSSLSCPRCHKQSNTFDPFHCISVQLPQIAQQAVFITVLYRSQHPKQVKLGLGVPPGSPVIALREQLQADTGIPSDRIVLAEINETGFARVFCDTHPMSSIAECDPIYCIETPEINNAETSISLIVANVHRQSDQVKLFSTPFCIQVSRDVSYTELQKKLLKEMQSVLKSEVFSYATPLKNMFQIRLQDPSADPDTYIEPSVEHPLFTEMIDLALSVLPIDVGPNHIKLLLEWSDPDKYFSDMTDSFVEHESVSQFKNKSNENANLTLEQCLEHYTKAETLGAEDAWRCPNCQKYLPVVKTLGLWSLPDILVVHFKRFRQQHTKGPQSAKLTTTVKFPLYGFDMSPHMARGANGQASAADERSPSGKRSSKRRDHSMHHQSKENRYDLYAVCYHQGDTLETGHYTAACKNPYDHQWYKFDDQKVNPVPADKMPEEIVNNEAYMLFYQRRKLDTVEHSGSSSTTSSDHWVSKIAAAPCISTPRASASTLSSDDKKDLKAMANKTADVIIDEPNTDIQSVELSSSAVPIAMASPINEKKEFEVDVEINVNNSDKSPVHIPVTPELVVKIRRTSENDIIEVEEIVDECQPSPEPQPEQPQKVVELIDLVQQSEQSKPLLSAQLNHHESPKPETTDKQLHKITSPSIAVKDEMIDDIGDSKCGDNAQMRRDEIILREETLSTSVPTQRSLWPLATTPPIIRGSLNFNDMLAQNVRLDRDFNNVRHSVSTACAIRQKENDTFAMIRGASSCSKDTLIFIDQQNHGLLNHDHERSGHFGGNKSMWISPVTPHKFIAISPKN